MMSFRDHYRVPPASVRFGIKAALPLPGSKSPVLGQEGEETRSLWSGDGVNLCSVVLFEIARHAACVVILRVRMGILFSRIPLKAFILVPVVGVGADGVRAG